jgi:hypothetical protein
MDEAEAMPGVIMVQVGTLDDTSWVKPAMQIYCDSAQPWVQLGGEMQRFAKMPGETRKARVGEGPLHSPSRE